MPHSQYAIWPEPFFLEFCDTYIHGDILRKPREEQTPTLLFLHGEQPSENRGVFNTLRQLLLSKYSLASCSFDFIGHGSTGGDRSERALHHRTRQVNEVIEGCFDSQPLSIITVDRAAINALHLLDTQPIINLVFINPVFPTAEAGLKLSFKTQSILGYFQGSIALITDATDQLLLEWKKSTHLQGKPVAGRFCTVIDNLTDQINLLAVANQQPRMLLTVAETIATTLKFSHSPVVKIP